MKKLLSIVVLILCAPYVSWADFPKFQCLQITGANNVEVSYTFRETKEGFRLQVSYAPGAAPIESDATTTARVRDLPHLNERAKFFSRLPGQFELNFPESQCKLKEVNSQLNWHCYVNAPGKVGKMSYEAISFFVFSQKVESAFGTSQWYNVGLEFKVRFEDLIGKEELDRMIKEAEADIREELEFRRQYQTVLRAATLIFENTAEHQSCQLR